MLPRQTAETLNVLTWNEIQKLHASLGLKATATTRTRADYNARILSAQPQPVADVPAPVTTEPKIWADATTEAQVGDTIRKPFIPTARVVGKEILGDGRTCLIVTFPGCHDRHVEEWVIGGSSIQEEISETIEPVVETAATFIPTTSQTEEPPNRGDNGRGRVTLIAPTTTATIVLPHAKAEDGLMAAIIKRTPFQERLDNLDYLYWLEGQAQLAIEKTVIGSEDEAIAYAHLDKINKDIEFYNKPKPEAQPSSIIVQLETQMAELKRDTLSLFKITAFDPAILPTDTNEPEQPATDSLESEGTIHWEIPQIRGTIVGKKGATRRFWVQNDDIQIALNLDFTAKESKHPNVRHRQIRDAIETGKQFNPMIFKLSSNFERDTKDYNGIGRVFQDLDGRWWAWAKDGVTGHPFSSEKMAFNYLESLNFTSKRLASVK